MKLTKAEAYTLRAAWVGELKHVAFELGYVSNMLGECDHPIVKMLGSVAWGRHPFEGGPDETKDDMVAGVGYLEGIRDACLRAARVLGDKKADKLLCEVPRLVQRRAYQ